MSLPKLQIQQLGNILGYSWKKILFLLVCLPMVLFAYSPTSSDLTLLDKIEVKLNKYLTRDSVKGGNMLHVLYKFKSEINSSERLQYFISKIKSQIAQYRESTINSFHYQLQSTTYKKLKSNKVDLVVIDIDDSELSKSEIVGLKKRGKMVVSYISIGEAEDYRDYWQDGREVGNPSFIDEENPDWPGNYKVLFWDSEWQQIILDKVEIIAKKGYDGVYLDIVDAYYYYEGREDVNSTQEMIDFVGRIRLKGQTINPDFMVIAQNAVDLYEYEDYKPLIDGFGKEDTWYNGNSVQDADETEYVLGFLDQAIADGKFVLAVDYPTNNTKICDFYSKCASHDFACTVMNRNLSIHRARKCEE